MEFTHMFTKFKNLRYRYRFVAVIVIAMFLAGGLYFLIASHAATAFLTAEPENGTKSGSATSVSDTTASNGSYVKFGSVVNPPTGTESQLISLIQDVTTAQGYKYTSKDSQGNTMDTVKVIDNPAGGYLAVYHSGNVVRLSTSTNVTTWTYKATLDPSASQPAIMATSDGGFVTGVEYNSGAGSGGQVRVRHYASLSALYAASPDRTYTAARTLSKCNEGTPNIYSVKLSPDIDHSVIDVGMHYHNNCDTDRQARGTLTNFTSWTAITQPTISNALIAAATAAGQTVNGNIGDRDSLVYGGTQYNIHEVQYVKGSTGQNGSFASWRPYLYDWSTSKAILLNMKTHHGSTAFANPSFSLIKDPDGKPGIVVTMFIPSEGAGSGEAGPLIYYKPLP
jgi:hypothetical protein